MYEIVRIWYVPVIIPNIKIPDHNENIKTNDTTVEERNKINVFIVHKVFPEQEM